MFTGMIQAVGHIETITAIGENVALSIEASLLRLSDVQIGDSIAVNGGCLTVTHLTKTHFMAHVSAETLRATTGLNQQHAVNLEKALRFNDRLGGQLVSVGVVTQFTDLGENWLLAIRAPHAISKYIAKKGSICINGVSLTINSVAYDTFTMNIIPHTLQNTTFKQLKIGSQVNCEIDQIARYVERMAEWTLETSDVVSNVETSK